MATVCEEMVDGLGLSDGVVLLLTIAAVNSSPITDRIGVINGLSRVEHVAASDTLDVKGFVPVVEAAAITGTFSSSAARSSLVNERFASTQRAVAFMPLFVVEAASMAQAVTQASAPRLVESIAIADPASPFVVSALPLVEQVAVRDTAVIPLFQMLVEQAAFSDAAVARGVGRLGSVEQVDVANQLEPRLVSRLSSLEQVVAADIAAMTVFASIAVRDAAYMDDSVLMPFGYAWTANTENMAMSRYENWPFNSMAEVDGRLVALSPAGAYLLERGVDDDGESIPASMRGGMTDLGDGSLKRVSYAYMGYEGGKVSLTVGTTESGAEVSYTYSAMPRTATDPSAGRIKLGKGMRSRYWRFTIANEDGDDFMLFDMGVLIDGLSRKI